MKFFQSSSSQSQPPTGNCLPGLLRRLPCFQNHTTHHHRINQFTEPFRGNPGVVAKLMGLDSIPQRIPLVGHQEDSGNLNARSQSPMVLEIKKGKFFVLGFETGCKGKGGLRSESKRRKLAEDDDEESKEKKKKKVVREKSKLLNESEEVDFEMAFLDQLVLELVYVF